MALFDFLRPAEAATEEESGGGLGGIDSKDLMTLMVLQQTPVLKPFAPIFAEQMKQRRGQRRAQAFGTGLAEASRLAESGDFEGASQVLARTTAQAGEKDVPLLMKQYEALEKKQAGRKAGETLRQVYEPLIAERPELAHLFGRNIDPSQIPAHLGRLGYEFQKQGAVSIPASPLTGKPAPGLPPIVIPDTLTIENLMRDPEFARIAQENKVDPVILTNWMNTGTPQEKQFALSIISRIAERAPKEVMARALQQKAGETAITEASRLRVLGAEEDKERRMALMPAKEQQQLMVEAGISPKSWDKMSTDEALQVRGAQHDNEAKKALGVEAAREKAEIGIRRSRYLLEAFPEKHAWVKDTELPLDSFVTVEQAAGMPKDSLVFLDPASHRQLAGFTSLESIMGLLEQAADAALPESRTMTVFNAIRLAVGRGIGGDPMIKVYDALRKGAKLPVAVGLQQSAQNLSEADRETVTPFFPGDRDTVESAKAGIKAFYGISRAKKNSLLLKPTVPFDLGLGVGTTVKSKSGKKGVIE